MGTPRRKQGHMSSISTRFHTSQVHHQDDVIHQCPGRRFTEAESAEVLRTLCGQWQSEHGEGSSHRHHAALELAPGHEECALLICRTIANGTRSCLKGREIIRCKDGLIMLGETCGMLLEAVGQTHATWTNKNHPDSPPLIWTRTWM